MNIAFELRADDSNLHFSVAHGRPFDFPMRFSSLTKTKSNPAKFSTENSELATGCGCLAQRWASVTRFLALTNLKYRRAARASGATSAASRSERSEAVILRYAVTSEVT